ncbi:carbonic anhydrase 12 [Protopterus annectens]|uniref:carbonic anhydrase 12 n=1 Tax=Protopterus annectens TaxID=7888 RepID=UPI001CF9AEEF|nr:carbonic anhydrase 12 [Protopterus annectens]
MLSMREFWNIVSISLCVQAQISQQLSDTGHTWNYDDGENDWSKNYPFCGGTHQSPIDIYSNIKYDAALTPIQVVGYDSPGIDHFTLSNDGHSVKVSLPATMYISSLKHKYTAVQLHLHWGDQKRPQGSEHTFNDRRFAAELHILHYNSDKYVDSQTATAKEDGLAVLGILLEVGSFNPTFENIQKYLSQVAYKDQEVQIPAFSIRNLLPVTLNEYYRYNGSLTTPPCYPSVLWTVFRQPVKISQEQLFSLETALFSSNVGDSIPQPMVNNFRQKQERAKRELLASFKEDFTFPIAIAFILGIFVIVAIIIYIIRKRRARQQSESRKRVMYAAAQKAEGTSSIEI